MLQTVWSKAGLLVVFAGGFGGQFLRGNPANPCGLHVAMPPPTFSSTQTAGDQGPMEVSCEAIVDSADGCHESNPPLVTKVLASFGWSN